MRTLHVLAALAVCALTSAALAEQIDNPEFTQWAKYKVGTFVTTQQASEMAAMASMPAVPGMPPGMSMADMMPKTTTTTKLTEVKPESLTLEVTTAVTQMGQGRNSTSTKVVPAKIEKPVATTTAPTTAAAALQDLKEGKETLEIKGQKIETTTREYTTTMTIATGRNTMGRGVGDSVSTSHMKIWSSPVIPGGMAKTESTSNNPQTGEVKQSLTVVDFNVVK